MLDIVVACAHADTHGNCLLQRLAAAGERGRVVRGWTGRGRALGSARHEETVVWVRRRRQQGRAAVQYRRRKRRLDDAKTVAGRGVAVVIVVVFVAVVVAVMAVVVAVVDALVCRHDPPDSSRQ